MFTVNYFIFLMANFLSNLVLIVQDSNVSSFVLDKDIKQWDRPVRNGQTPIVIAVSLSIKAFLGMNEKMQIIKLSGFFYQVKYLKKTKLYI